MLRPTKVLQGPHISAHHISVISTYQRPSEFPRLENSAQLTLKVIVHLGCSQVDDSCWLKMAHYRKLDANIIHGIFHVISCYLISWYGIRNAAISFPNDFHAHPEVWDWESYNTQGVWHHATRNYVNVTWVSLPQQLCLSPDLMSSRFATHAAIIQCDDPQDEEQHVFGSLCSVSDQEDSATTKCSEPARS